jgi:EAL domain-containing protein (putative c-di-GMP-specific phosphodiesterase class I)
MLHIVPIRGLKALKIMATQSTMVNKGLRRICFFLSSIMCTDENVVTPMSVQPPMTSEQRRVLVIDDDVAFCKFMERVISGLGRKVRTRSQIHTSDLVALTPNDFIFLDMVMPGADGIQVLEQLARHKVKSSIVLMSGQHDEVLVTAEAIARKSGLRVGGLMAKPVRAAEISRLLEQTPALTPPRSGPSPSQINDDVLKGLERREFDVYLQPIVHLETGRPLYFEALARWRSDKFNLVMPDRFISVAAGHGILPLLTNQILDKSLAYAAKLGEQGLPCRVSVNISVEDLLDRDFPEKITARILAHGLSADCLTLEVTEASATANEIQMLGVLARLRLRGVGLAIDDFGTCYSSLERLSTVPFTILKIDRGFISDIVATRSAREIVNASIVLAHRLGMKAVAEGIESEAQRALLREMNCDQGQGYLFSPPVQFEELLRHS